MKSSFLRFLAFLLLPLAVAVAQAQPTGTVVVIGQPRTNPSGLSRGPDPSKRFQRVIAAYPPSDVVGISPGLPLVSVGFRLRTPATSAVSGTLRVWLRSSTDPFYSLTTDWVYSLQNPVVFQQVYNGPLTIPAAAGWYDVAFQIPFTYTGGGFYLAYEWETTTPVAASGSYECDDAIPQALRGGTGTTAFPAQVATISSYRPQLRVAYRTPGVDAALLAVLGPGKLPGQACVSPFPVQARVRNAGSQPLTNVVVTLTPQAGAGPGPVQATIASLAAGAETTVLLLGLAPSQASGYVRYTVGVAAAGDTNPANNTRTDSTLATANELSYVRGFPTADFGTSGAGFNSGSGSGTLLCRFPLRQAALVSAVTVRLWNHTNNPGNRVFAVVLDEAGHLLARSADYVLPPFGTASSRQTLALPAPVRVAGRAFYAGLAQVAPVPVGRYYYPLALQTETPVLRDSAYYSVVGDSALTGLKAPREIRTLGRFMIETTLVTAPLATRPAGAPLAPADAWPNPAHEALHFYLPAGTRTVALYDLAGRLVRPPVALRADADGTAALPLAGLVPGLYLVVVRDADGPAHTQRVQVE